MTHRLPAVDAEHLADLIDELAPTVTRTWPEGSCIGLTNVVCRVARYFGVKAEAVPVEVALWSAKLEAWMQAGGKKGEEPPGELMLILGRDHPIDDPDLWPGHLAALLGGRYLVDLTIDQMGRPDLGLVVEPLLLTLPPSWAKGDVTATGQYGDILISYRRLHRTDYRGCGDWENHAAISWSVGVLVHLVSERLERDRRRRRTG